jgi:hypothetical protein
MIPPSSSFSKESEAPLYPVGRRLSVCVAVRPGEKAIAERCLDGILNQVDPIGTEVVLATDLRTEDIADHIEGIFAAAKVSHRLGVLRTPNRAPSRNALFQACIAASRGSFLAFVHPQDEWRPGRLARLEPLLAHHDFLLSTEIPLQAAAADPLRAFLEGSRGVRSSALYRRSLLEELEGYPSHRGLLQSANPEYELWLKALLFLKTLGQPSGKTQARASKPRFQLLPNVDVESREADDPLTAGGQIPFPFGPEVEAEVKRLLQKWGAVRENWTVLKLLGSRSIPPRYWGTLVRRWTRKD